MLNIPQQIHQNQTKTSLIPTKKEFNNITTTNTIKSLYYNSLMFFTKLLT